MPADLLPRLQLQHASGQVAIRSRRRAWFRQLGLRCASEFLNLPGDIISGHRDRHVVEVTLAGQRFYLKKEHRTPLSIRWRNWRDGFGAVSLSEREAQTLMQLRRSGVSVPSCLAYGEDEQGRSFLMLKRVPGLPLPSALRSKHLCTLGRWRVAHELGEQVARVHLAGYDAPDLSAKHVMVKRTGNVVLLDWPRARHFNTLDHNRCLMALASLHASISMQLAGMRERLIALRSWMHAIGFRGTAAPLARKIMPLAEKLTKRRSIREQLQPGQAPRVRWVAGEALCVTREYAADLNGVIPDWLCDAANERGNTSASFVDSDLLLLRFAPANWLLSGVARLAGRPLQSPGIRLAGLLFRMARHRIPVPTVLAFGARPDGGGFLLCRIPPTVSLNSWLNRPQLGRARLLQHVTDLFKRCRQAGAVVTAESIRVIEGRPPGLLVMPSTHFPELVSKPIITIPSRRAA